MHKDTIEALKEVVCYDRTTGRSPSELLTIYTYKRDSVGWECLVLADEEYTHSLSHVKSIAKSIGLFYGESLHVERVSDRVLELG